MLLHKLFEERALENSEKTAVVFRDRSITYGELDYMASKLATKILSVDEGSRLFVGVMVDRSIEMIISLLAVLKSGAAYLPLDPSYPQKRLNYFLEKSGTTLVIKEGFRKPYNERINYLQVDSPCDTIALPPRDERKISTDSLAYIIFTSGSTGDPKGVMVEHKSIVNSVLWRNEFYSFNCEDTILQIPSLSFDSSVLDIFCALSSGSKLLLCSNQDLLDAKVVDSLILDNKVTSFLAVPSWYEKYIKMSNIGRCKLRIITLAGENLSENLLKAHFDRFPETILVNEYGPTEASVCATAEKFAKYREPITIGSPISNIRCALLDGSMNVIEGVGFGQLALSGIGVSRGYINDKKSTDLAFVSLKKNPDEKVYLTGDLVYRNENNEIIFKGRMDDQVKINGIRINFLEIERSIRKCSGLNVVVGVVGNQIFAVLESNLPIDIDGIKYSLNEVVPKNLIPSFIISLTHIPRSPSGKMDRYSAMRMAKKIVDNEKAQRVYEDDDLGKIKKIIGEFVSVKVDMERNFFDMGITSSNIIIIVDRVRKEVGIELSAATLYQYPTISSLINYLNGAPALAEKEELIKRRRNLLGRKKSSEKAL